MGDLLLSRAIGNSYISPITGVIPKRAIAERTRSNGDSHLRVLSGSQFLAFYTKIGSGGAVKFHQFRIKIRIFALLGDFFGSDFLVLTKGRNHFLEGLGLHVIAGFKKVCDYILNNYGL